MTNECSNFPKKVRSTSYSEALTSGEKLPSFEVDQNKCIQKEPPYCQAVCPLHVDVKGYIGLIGEARFDEAFRLIRQKLPFPVRIDVSGERLMSLLLLLLSKELPLTMVKE